jgi:hypothetical protein
MSDYIDCKIVNIKRGKGSRSHIIYATLISKRGDLLISATLEYILEALHARIPTEESE